MIEADKVLEYAEEHIQDPTIMEQFITLMTSFIADLDILEICHKFEIAASIDAWEYVLDCAMTLAPIAYVEYGIEEQVQYYRRVLNTQGNVPQFN